MTGDGSVPNWYPVLTQIPLDLDKPYQFWQKSAPKPGTFPYGYDVEPDS